MDRVTDTTEDQLLEALRAATERDDSEGSEPGTITSTEAAEQMDIPLPRARRVLAKLARQGRLERDMVWRDIGWGHRQRFKGYRWVEK